MSAKTSSGGITIFTALFLIFLVLKLVGVISWSWWWITAPLWGPWLILLLVGAIVLVGFGIVGSVVAVVEFWRDQK